MPEISESSQMLVTVFGWNFSNQPSYLRKGQSYVLNNFLSNWSRGLPIFFRHNAIGLRRRTKWAGHFFFPVLVTDNLLSDSDEPFCFQFEMKGTNPELLWLFSREGEGMGDRNLIRHSGRMFLHAHFRRDS